MDNFGQRIIRNCRKVEEDP
ncbi:hypothetical protein F383_34083 [Gossypium arboreum]|uniref:Uncharacterized protein n=1 Tax=Gossypium arboreum TaxID=29729 RepID=A0A0B0MZS7_GOSAR|nr:hypothetical protein F383_34083 [Gossypium arboreum]